MQENEQYYKPYLQVGGTRFFNSKVSSVATSYDLFVPVWQPTPCEVAFIDARIYDRAGKAFEGNFHLGYRELSPDARRMYGVYGAIDVRKTIYDNYFTQITFGGEYRFDRLFIGANFYNPFGLAKVIQKQGEEIREEISGDYKNTWISPKYSGEKALGGGDIEVGYEIIDNLTGYVGGYHFNAIGTGNVSGSRAAVTYDIVSKNDKKVLGLFDKATIEGGIQKDNVRGTVGYLNLNFKVGLSAKHTNNQYTGMARHMDKLIRRDVDIVTRPYQMIGAEYLSGRVKIGGDVLPEPNKTRIESQSDGVKGAVSSALVPYTGSYTAQQGVQSGVVDTNSEYLKYVVWKDTQTKPIDTETLFGYKRDGLFKANAAPKVEKISEPSVKLLPSTKADGESAEKTISRALVPSQDGIQPSAVDTKSKYFKKIVWKDPRLEHATNINSEGKNSVIPSISGNSIKLPSSIEDAISLALVSTDRDEAKSEQYKKGQGVVDARKEDLQPFLGSGDNSWLSWAYHNTVNFVYEHPYITVGAVVTAITGVTVWYYYPTIAKCIGGLFGPININLTDLGGGQPPANKEGSSAPGGGPTPSGNMQGGSSSSSMHDSLVTHGREDGTAPTATAGGGTLYDRVMQGIRAERPNNAIPVTQEVEAVVMEVVDRELGIARHREIPTDAAGIRQIVETRVEHVMRAFLPRVAAQRRVRQVAGAMQTIDRHRPQNELRGLIERITREVMGQWDEELRLTDAVAQTNRRITEQRLEQQQRARYITGGEMLRNMQTQKENGFGCRKQSH